MIFSLVFLVSFILFFFPLTAFTAPAAPAPELESRASKTYKVTVGNNGKLLYKPQYVYAKPGDWIEFKFHPSNHTATQSTFDHPCIRAFRGWSTGFIPVPKNQTSHFPSRRFEVPNSDPQWFHCGQTGHCRAGMVFAVNPPKKGNMTFEKYQKRAMHFGNQ
ncbi:hypothetical protein FRC12_023054 [Ceratobasidium sp. 428]|nr:hypothetical protein FRC12_023054 [Ceratobasidium sp. 428]